MPSSNLSARWESLKRPLFQCSVVAALTSLGIWGHVTHWGSGAAHADATSHIGPRAHLETAESDPAAEKPIGTFEKAPVTAPGSPGTLGRIRLPSAKMAADMGIHSVSVERRPMSHEVTAAGVVNYDPTRQAQLSSRAVGTVWRVEKQVGQPVRAGEVLAIVDSSAVGEAKAAFLRSLADVELCSLLHEKMQSFGNGEVAAKQVQEAETALRKARVDLFNAQQAMISLGLPIKLERWLGHAESELQLRVKFMGLPESLKSGLDPDATTANLLPILAPFDGVVTGRDLTLGEVISPTGNHFEIADVSRMWIVLNVREQDADQLQLGQKVEFNAGTATVDCAISWLSTAVDEKTRTIECRCETANPEIKTPEGKPTGKRLLRANVFGMGKICTHENPHALVVPTKSLQRYRDLILAFVEVSPGVYEARNVRAGVTTRDVTEVIEGLADNEAVVGAGSHILKAELQRVGAVDP